MSKNKTILYIYASLVLLTGVMSKIFSFFDFLFYILLIPLAICIVLFTLIISIAVTYIFVNQVLNIFGIELFKKIKIPIKFTYEQKNKNDHESN